jgi:hypothetical protein
MDPDAKRLDWWLAIGRFSITAFVTVIFTVVFAWGFLVKNIDNQVFTQAAGMIFAFWFGAATGTRMMGGPPPATTTTTDTDASGAKRQVTMTAPPGEAAPRPLPAPAAAAAPGVADPLKGDRTP